MSSQKPQIHLRLGTRKSVLAMAQTRYAQKLLQEKHPDAKVEICKPISAYGDLKQNESLKELAKVDPGLFTKDLEGGLVSKIYDIAVHSLKDVPTTLPEGLVIGAITDREDPRDALVVREEYKGKGGLSGLPKNAIVGTSSVRREAMVKALFPDYTVKLVRGAVDTRIRKLDSGEYDALILAVAGLNRLGENFHKRIEQFLEPPQFYYGVGQGALCLQCREDDKQTLELVRAIEDEDTALKCRAERAFLKTLQGGCQVPVGVVSEIKGAGKQLSLTGVILSLDGRSRVQVTRTGVRYQPEELGTALAEKAMTEGAKELLIEIGSHKVEDVSKRPNVYGSAEKPNESARPMQ